MYAMVGLVIAYFSFRHDCPNLISAPIQKVFGVHGRARGIGWLSDLLAIYAIAIGMGGAIAMGVFQVQSGVETLFSLTDPGALDHYGCEWVLIAGLNFCVPLYCLLGYWLMKPVLSI